MEDDYLGFISDFAKLCVDEALETKARVEHPKPESSQDEVAFQWGRLMAYSEVLTMFIHEAEVFGIAEMIPAIKDVNPDLLVNVRPDSQGLDQHTVPPADDK